ncbi:hypothetical protein POM88_013410 [Heracleum sosnowskyi]|uniref:Homeobox domain-containing protein n=1 Tax=Heracleum sosnowskyi TaxID=360622 RepID=A0AAD8N2N9_9APIA|nr:hypothetical protein POM88_013410 [Heracleum sosnowskyi]
MIVFEPHQPVLRPQRGLPERAVAVLRAWLFDHFLHPYPTDTDKHMLATQTGLTRNQVSNWFINARVCVWKPMVEEIHVLETKGSAKLSSQMGNPGCNTASDIATSQSNFQPISKICETDSNKSRGGVEIGSVLQAVSLILGLRQSAESAQQQQQQDQYQQQFGGHMILDFVG